MQMAPASVRLPMTNDHMHRHDCPPHNRHPLRRIFDGNDKKGLRVLVFSSLGATAIFPAVHYASMVQSETFFEAFDLLWLFGVSVPVCGG